MLDFARERLKIGIQRYGHGVRVRMDTTTFGTNTNDWFEMAIEEFVDGAIYTAADYIRTHEPGMASSAVNGDDNAAILKLLEDPSRVRSEKHRTMIETLVACVDSARL